ncbi:MAG: thioredoxin [Armatimonadota bacterium]
MALFGFGKKNDTATVSGKVGHVNAQNFDQEVLQSDIPVIVDFWAPWCGPCRMLAPVLEQVAEAVDGKVKVVKLNTDEEQAIAGKYGIQGIPTMILFKNGEAVSRQVGLAPKGTIESWALKNV